MRMPWIFWFHSGSKGHETDLPSQARWRDVDLNVHFVYYNIRHLSEHISPYISVREPKATLHKATSFCYPCLFSTNSIKVSIPSAESESSHSASTPTRCIIFLISYLRTAKLHITRTTNPGRFGALTATLTTCWVLLQGLPERRCSSTIVAFLRKAGSPTTCPCAT